MRKTTLLLLIFLWGTAQAQPPALKNGRFELVLHPEARVVSQFDNGWEKKMVVEHQGQQLRINWGDEQALILFPNSTLRLLTSSRGETETINVYLDADRYQVKTSPREIGWLLPSGEVFFRTRGGKISQAVGSADFLKLRRDTRGGRVTLESSVGVTDALLNSRGELESFSGPEIAQHVYLVRGLAFRQGPVTLRFPLPEGPFLEGLPADRFLTVEKQLEPLPEPVAAPTEERHDPLQARPATWEAPQLRAKFNAPDEDPLSVKKERRVKYDEDPLKARTEKDSEELLRVKDY